MPKRAVITKTPGRKSSRPRRGQWRNPMEKVAKAIAFEYPDRIVVDGLAYSQEYADVKMESIAPVSIREDILSQAAKTTGQERNKTYGDPMVNLECIGEFKELFRRWHGRALAVNQSRHLSYAEQEAVDSLLVKVGRIATGRFHPDNYLDAAAYSAIAGEAAFNSQPVTTDGAGKPTE